MEFSRKHPEGSDYGVHTYFIMGNSDDMECALKPLADRSKMFGAGLHHKTITKGLETSRICRNWETHLENWPDQVVKRNAGNYLCVWNCQRGGD